MKYDIRYNNLMGVSMPVTLINVFSVPQGKEDDFMKWWHEVKDKLRNNPASSAGNFIKASNLRADIALSMSRCGKTKTCIGERMKKERGPDESAVNPMGGRNDARPLSCELRVLTPLASRNGKRICRLPFSYQIFQPFVGSNVASISAKSLACSSSFASMPSIIRRLVGSFSPKYRAISP